MAFERLDSMVAKEIARLEFRQCTDWWVMKTFDVSSVNLAHILVGGSLGSVTPQDWGFDFCSALYVKLACSLCVVQVSFR